MCHVYAQFTLTNITYCKVIGVIELLRVGWFQNQHSYYFTLRRTKSKKD